MGTFTPGQIVYIVHHRHNIPSIPNVAEVKVDRGDYVTVRYAGALYDTEVLRRRVRTTRHEAKAITEFMAARWDRVMSTWLDDAWREVAENPALFAEPEPTTRQRTRGQPVVTRTRERTR